MCINVFTIGIYHTSEGFDKSFKGIKCISIIITVSININEVIRAILDFFIQKFHEHKNHKTLTSEQKLKMLLKNI